MSMVLLVIIGTVAVFAVVIIAAIEAKRADKGLPSLLDKNKSGDENHNQ